MREAVDRFMEAFGMSEYPIFFRYAYEVPEGTLMPSDGVHVCIFALLAKTRKDGIPAAFSGPRHGCHGGGYYLGYHDTPRDGIEHFLSCGIPGRMEGERYLKDPEIARARIAGLTPPPAGGKFALFTRADGAQPSGDPEVVVFFASADILGGLHVLANYDRKDEGVTAPFSSGCGAVVSFPRKERASGSNRAVLGMFDLSARPHVEPEVLTFAVPYRRFLTMAENVPESFLLTKTWGALKKRSRART